MWTSETLKYASTSETYWLLEKCINQLQGVSYVDAKAIKTTADIRLRSEIPDGLKSQPVTFSLSIHLF